MNSLSKPVKRALWGAMALVVLASAALGTHVYVRNTIEDAAAFVEKHYNVSQFRYDYYTFDIMQQALVLHNVSATATVQDENKMTIDKISFNNCDLKTIRPKHCELSIIGLKTENQDLWSSLTKLLGPASNEVLQTKGIDMHYRSDTDDNGVTDMKAKVSLATLADYEISFAFSGIDMEDLSEKSDAISDQKEKAVAMMKNFIEQMKVGRIHYIGIAFRDGSGVLAKQQLDKMTNSFTEAKVWQDFVAAPQAVSGRLSYNGGLDLAMISAGQYDPENFATMIKLNGKDFTEGADLLKSTISPFIKPETAAVASTFLDNYSNSVEGLFEQR